MLQNSQAEFESKVAELSEYFIDQTNDIAQIVDMSTRDTGIMLATLVIGYLYSINVTEDNRESLRTFIWSKLSKLLDEVDVERGVQPK